MGLGGISVWQLLIILVIVMLLFGTKKLHSFGRDLGGAVNGFKKAVANTDSDLEQTIENEEESKIAS